MKKIIWILCLLLCSSQHIFAQAWPENVLDFEDEVKKRLGKIKNEGVEQFLKTFPDKWETGGLNSSDKKVAIQQINQLQKKGFLPYPDVSNYLNTVFAVKNFETKIRISPDEFFKVSQECIDKLKPSEIRAFYLYIANYIKEGIAFKTSQFSWRFTKTEPRLLMRAEMDSTTGKISEFPCFQFAQTDLVYMSKTDTGVIQGTKGVINLTTKRFSGEGGRYDWSRLGLPKESVYCLLDTFDVDLSLQHFKADSVTFYYTTLIPKPLKGVLIEHYKNTGGDKSKSEYPYFKSSEGGITINNFIRNVTYYGGFSLKGLSKYGSKTETEYASMLINNREGKKVLKLYSDEFVLDPKQLTTRRAAVTLYIENDSLTHPAMQLQYDVESGDMTLWRDPKDINSHQPIMSSYHRMGFWVEALSWNSNKDIMEFTSFIDKGNKISALESYDFFLQQQFKQFRGVLTFYPIGMLYRYWTEVLKSGKKVDVYKPVEEYSGWEVDEDEPIIKDPSDDFVPVIDTTDSPVIKVDSTSKPIPKIFIDNFLTWGDTLGLKIDPKVFDSTQESNRIRKGWRKLTEQKESLKRMLIELEGAGFVDYVPEEDYVILKGKLARWARAARDLKDYDIIQLQSQVDQGKNGEFNVKTQQIRMFGVFNFPLSDSQYVFVKPYKSQVGVDKNRTLEMGGIVDAGKLTFFGKGFKKYRYEYINHKIVCDSLDSLKFVPERDPKFQNGGTNAKLANAIGKLRVEGVNGAIYINKPNNKNSRKKHPEYPVFDCYSESYVYWDEKGVQGGVYNRDSLRFTIDPFVIDSLETFDMRALEFQGEMYAGNIMPSFRDTLKPMNDDTYGVQMITDKGGVPLYGEKGKFYNKVEMDGHGLHGNGQIDYLATIATSDSFFFHFDSVMAVTKTFELKQGNYGSATYPQINAKKIRYKWYTKKDELVLQSEDTPFDLFEKRATLNGQIKITPTGVKADGIFTMDELSIEARDMDLGQFKFETPTGRMQVADAKDKSYIHFVADSVKIKYDVNADTANIEANKNGIAFCQFPGSKFKTSLGIGTYNKKTGDIDLSARSSYGKNNFFESTEPKMQGLRFIAKESHYNVNKKEIQVSGADSILVADAVVFPDSGKVKIRDDGYLSKLANAQIVANRQTRYHNVFGAEVNIRSKIDYIGSGKYKYINDQNIYFADLYVRKDTITQGVGIIPESQKFFVTNRIYFKDSVVLKANEKFLFFDGEVKIQSNNPFLDNWFGFPKEPAEPVAVNPDTIFIPIDKPKNRSNEELTVGLEYLPFRRNFYSNFLQIRREKKDQDVLTAKGGLSVDRNTGEFKIGSMEKILGKSFKGRLVSYNDSTRIIVSRGLVDFPYHKAPETAQYKMAGKFVDDPNTQKLTAEVAMTIEFPIIPKNGQQQIAMQFNNYTDNNPDIDYTSRLLQESIAEIVDSTDSTEQRTKKMIQSLETITSIKQVKVGKDVQDFLFLSNLKLTWSDKYKAFWYKGDIGIVSIVGTPINKMVKGYLDYVIGKPLPSGQSMPDTLRLYLEIDEDNWVYFGFSNYILRTTGTRGGYKNIVKEVLAKQNKKKSDPNKKEMQLEECTEDTKDIFIRNFSRYLLDSGVREEVKEEERKEEIKEDTPKEEKKEEAPQEEKKPDPPQEEKKEK